VSQTMLCLSSITDSFIPVLIRRNIWMSESFRRIFDEQKFGGEFGCRHQIESLVYS